MRLRNLTFFSKPSLLTALAPFLSLCRFFFSGMRQGPISQILSARALYGILPPIATLQAQTPAPQRPAP